ncbi:MAG: alkene reductase, partial [Moraxellaceae bacterium]
ILQLMHVGRIAHSANMPEGARILGPSAVAANSDMWTDTAGMQKTETPEAMTTQDIKTTITEFAEAAKRGIAAGFDGVELHGANGYLLEQFLNPHVNTRTDEYGGSMENRCRFVLEVTSAVAAAIGKDKTAIRLSPYSMFNDLPAYNEVAKTYTYLSAELQKAGILYLHLVDYAARASEEGLKLIETIRKNFTNPLILNAGYTKERAEKALEWGADLISFGSPFIANPDLPIRMEQNLELAKPDPNTFYTADAIGYTDYAFSTENK